MRQTDRHRTTATPTSLKRTPSEFSALMAPTMTATQPFIAYIRNNLPNPLMLLERANHRLAITPGTSRFTSPSVLEAAMLHETLVSTRVLLANARRRGE